MASLTIPEAISLATAHLQAGRSAEAQALCHQILALAPGHGSSLHLLGVAESMQGDHAAGVQHICQAIAAEPAFAHYHNSLGLAWLALGRGHEALAAFRDALALRPGYAIAHFNAGCAWEGVGDRNAARAAYHQAIAAEPRCAHAHSNLALLEATAGDLDKAMRHGRSAVESDPDFADGWNNLAGLLEDCGRVEEAIPCYRRALALSPSHAAIHSNLIHSLHFHPSASPAEIAEEQGRWNAAHAMRAPSPRAYANTPDPDRRLVVGYVSPNFRDHVVGRNLFPLLTRHDRKSFDLVCYHTGAADGLTVEYQRLADRWRSCERVSDEKLAGQIRQDGVDVLVDLTLHLAGNRLPLFTSEPAPVQLSFAGYPGSAGVRGIHHRISDPYLDPPGESPRGETVFRIGSFWCYDPLGDSVEVTALPAAARRYTTFGYLGKFAKVNDTVLALWARVLHAVDGSQMMILSPLGAHRDRTWQVLAALGIERGRIQFAPPSPRLEYLGFYQGIDIVLDTFPYNGHTTSLEALWMGVPVVSLAGATPVSRAGLSQLSNLGLADLVAFSPDAYVHIARTLACDHRQLAELRRDLRARMKDSVLMDSEHFAAEIEGAYRAMWRRWCSRWSSTTPSGA